MRLTSTARSSSRSSLRRGAFSIPPRGATPFWWSSSLTTTREQPSLRPTPGSLPREVAGPGAQGSGAALPRPAGLLPRLQ